MFYLPKPVAKLIESFEFLPGIGPKTAQRLTFYLLHVPQEYLENFAEALTNLKKNTVECSLCHNVSEEDPCAICGSPGRDKSTICVVEQPIDVLSMERTGKYHGTYHILHGAINPLHNIGPDELRINQLLDRLQKSTHPITEIILATNLTLEGEATAMYLTKQLQKLTTHPSTSHSTVSSDRIGSGLRNSQLTTMRITRLAHGLPVGGDLEYADEMTLSRALEGRREYN